MRRLDRTPIVINVCLACLSRPGSVDACAAGSSWQSLYLRCTAVPVSTYDAMQAAESQNPTTCRVLDRIQSAAKPGLLRICICMGCVLEGAYNTVYSNDYYKLDCS